jgi:hypothetical protein
MEAVITVLVGIFIGWFVWMMVKKDELGTFMSFGTILYGNTKTTTGKVKTKWIVLFFVPGFPLKSYEVFSEYTTRESPVAYNTNYQLKELPNLYKPQVIPIVVVVWPLLLLCTVATIASAFAH